MVDSSPAPTKRKNLALLRFLYIIFISLFVAYIAFNYLNIITATMLVKALATGIFGIAIVEIAARIVYYYMQNNINRAEAKTLSDITRIFGYSFLLLAILAVVFGYQYLDGFLVSAGFLGVVVGLAAQNTLSNFIAGIYLLASKAIEPNDNVVLHTWQYTMQPQTYPHDKFVPGFAGVVESIGVLYTKMVNEEGIPVYVPNNIVAQAMVINYHRAKEHSRRIQFDVDIAVPFSRLEKIVAEVMKANKIDSFNVKLEYLHINLYVVTVRVKVQEEEAKQLKSEIFNEILKELGEIKARQSKSQSKLA